MLQPLKQYREEGGGKEISALTKKIIEHLETGDRWFEGCDYRGEIVWISPSPPSRTLSARILAETENTVYLITYPQTATAEKGKCFPLHLGQG